MQVDVSMVPGGGQSVPEMMKDAGASLFSMQTAMVPGLVAMRFGEKANMNYAIDVAAEFINGLGAVPVKQAQVGNFGDDEVCAQINAMAKQGGERTIVFYLPDMTQLRNLDTAASNKSWGPHVAGAHISGNIRRLGM